MKKIFALLLTAFVALCANELKFGTAANYPPFEYIDENNKITGFDIDLIDEISKRRRVTGSNLQSAKREV